MKRAKDIVKWADEIADFAKMVEDFTGKTLTVENLDVAIKIINAKRRALARVYEARKATNCIPISGKDAEGIRKSLLEAGFDVAAFPVVATGYGRVAVSYADKVVTEITCHGRGADFLFGGDGTVIDVGGQDTKAISMRSGHVVKFVMNDKCFAGTGRFLEIMADRLGVS